MPRREDLATVVLLRDGVEISSWPLPAEGPPTLAVVDRLARLRLAAGRHGCTTRLRRLAPQLAELLALVGLDGVLPGCPGATAGSGVEALREAEGGEEVGVEEVVVADDPVA
ncbi:MAG: hypothetical protein ACRD0N_01280 [Acidimicrobiales bacterium]